MEMEQLLLRIQRVLKEVREISVLIRTLGASNLQEVIDYEDELNKYSVIDYNEISQTE